MSKAVSAAQRATLPQHDGAGDRPGATSHLASAQHSGINGHGARPPEQRHDSRRLAYDVQVGVATRHRLFVGLTSNISSGGLFVATDEPLARGDQIEVRFRIPGSEHVFQKRAEVAWIRPFDEGQSDSHQQAGAGVRLLDLSEDEKRMLNAFLDVHEPLFFEP